LNLLIKFVNYCILLFSSSSVFLNFAYKLLVLLFQLFSKLFELDQFALVVRLGLLEKRL